MKSVYATLVLVTLVAVFLVSRSDLTGPRRLSDAESSTIRGADVYIVTIFAKCAPLELCADFTCGGTDMSLCDYERKSKTKEPPLGCHGKNSPDFGFDCEERWIPFKDHKCSTWQAWCGVFLDGDGIPYCAVDPNRGGVVTDATAPDGCRTL
jgi:hypothetical protein